MRTPAQIAASRANGAKSRGPRTPEGKLASAANSAFSTGPRTPDGKARSARNAAKHNLLAHSVVVPGESHAEFIDLMDTFKNNLEPVGEIEEREVETIVVAEWRRRRVWCLEMACMADSILRQENSPEPSAISGVDVARAFGHLAKDKALELLRRYEAGFSRDYRRGMAHLEHLQAMRHAREQRQLDRMAEALEADDCVDPRVAREKVAREKVTQEKNILEQTEPETAPVPARPATPGHNGPATPGANQGDHDPASVSRYPEGTS